MGCATRDLFIERLRGLITSTNVLFSPSDSPACGANGSCCLDSPNQMHYLFSMASPTSIAVVLAHGSSALVPAVFEFVSA